MEDLFEFIKSGKNEHLEQLLVKNPALIAYKSVQGISLIQFAAYCRNNLAVDILLKFTTKLDFFEASCIGDLDTIKPLLEETPELLHSFSADGFTALGLATFFGHFTLVELLLNKGADPNIASNNPFNVAPIHSACAISAYDLVELLIMHGANVNAKQMQSITPLHTAAHNGQTELSKLLIENGAEINAKTDQGHTALYMAHEKYFLETAALLIKYGGK
jgi:ankyrin repeat protein